MPRYTAVPTKVICNYGVGVKTEDEKERRQQGFDMWQEFAIRAVLKDIPEGEERKDD